MLFAFPEPWTGAFWMKDTLIPLSIAFWGTTAGSHDRGDDAVRGGPCETYPAADTYTYALEMNAGWFAEHGVEVGDLVGVELPG